MSEATDTPTPITFLKIGDPCALDAQVLAVDSLGRRFRLSDVVEVNTVSGKVVDSRGGVVFRRVEIDLSRCSPDEIAEQRRWQEERNAGREPGERRIPRAATDDSPAADPPDKIEPSIVPATGRKLPRSVE